MSLMTKAKPTTEEHWMIARPPQGSTLFAGQHVRAVTPVPPDHWLRNHGYRVETPIPDEIPSDVIFVVNPAQEARDASALDEHVRESNRGDVMLTSAQVLARIPTLKGHPELYDLARAKHGFPTPRSQSDPAGTVRGYVYVEREIEAWLERMRATKAEIVLLIG
jgi:hypothetical protein